LACDKDVDRFDCNIVFEAGSLNNSFGDSVGWVALHGAIKALEQQRVIGA
jgi:hypothetical protein